MDIEKSDFSFLGHKIIDVSMKVGDNIVSDNLGLNINCEGGLDYEKQLFVLTMKVHVEDSEKVLNIDVKAEGYFKYQGENLEQLLGFIGINSPALLFPYIRSFISMLTSISGLKTVTLPTLNLSNIGKKLADNLKKELEQK